MAHHFAHDVTKVLYYVYEVGTLCGKKSGIETKEKRQFFRNGLEKAENKAKRTTGVQVLRSQTKQNGKILRTTQVQSQLGAVPNLLSKTTELFNVICEDFGNMIDIGGWAGLATHKKCPPQEPHVSPCILSHCSGTFLFLFIAIHHYVFRGTFRVLR